MNQELDEEELDEESVFYENVEGNSGVCSNCFRRISFECTPHHELPDAVAPLREYSDSVYFDHFKDDANTGRPSVKRSYCICGAVDRVKIRPFDADQMITVAQRVADRLDEEDVDFSRDVFFDSVRTQKSDPDKQFNEEKIFEVAVERAVL